MSEDVRLHILQHSLGTDEYGRRQHDRNYFVTGVGNDDYQHCMALVEAGLMRRRHGNEITGGDDVFHVTDAGRLYVTQHSPNPPKLTRSQRRYEDFLDADCGLPFGEWLKTKDVA